MSDDDEDYNDDALFDKIVGDREDLVAALIDGDEEKTFFQIIRKVNQIGLILSKENIFEATKLVSTHIDTIYPFIHSDSIQYIHSKYREQCSEITLFNLLKGFSLVEVKSGEGPLGRGFIYKRYISELEYRESKYLLEIEYFLKYIGMSDNYRNDFLLYKIKCKYLMQNNIYLKQNIIDKDYALDRSNTGYYQELNNIISHYNSKLELHYNKYLKEEKNVTKIKYLEKHTHNLEITLNNTIKDLKITQRKLRSVEKLLRWNKISELVINMTPIERLRLVINQKEIAPARFPKNWAVITISELSNAKAEELIALMNRLTRVKAGQWRKLYFNLQTYLGFIKDKD